MKPTPSSCVASRRHPSRRAVRGDRRAARSLRRAAAGIVLALLTALVASGVLLRAQSAAPASPPANGEAAKQAPAKPPASGQPASGQPATGQPATGKPASGQPASGQPPTGQPPTGQQRPAGQQPPAGQAEQPQVPTEGPAQFKTGINFVRVDVQVSDKKGAPIVDLTQNDFEVFEDGKPQTVETFRLIKVDGNAPEGETPREIRSDYVLESEASREDVRLFAIYLDDYHVRRGASMGVRKPLVDFIKTQLGPMDLVGIMYPLTPFSAIPFTRNHDSIIRIIEKFDGRKYDYRPLNQFEEQYAYYPVETVERIRNQVSLTGLRALVTGLGTLREGRKTVILVSEGYSNYVPPQMRDANAQFRGLGNPNSRNPLAGDNDMNEDRARFFQQTDMLSDLRQVFTEANRANTAIYTLDPRGLAVFEHDINEGVGLNVDRESLNETQNTLRTIAEETDGRAIVNQNDLDTGLKQAVRDASAYYLIGYNSADAPTDGKFHSIRVRVKRPGAQVRARKGYWAYTAEDATRATAPPKAAPDPLVTRALAETEMPNRARVVRTWIGTSRAENGKTAVTLVWEAVPPAPGTTARSAPPTQVSVQALGSQNTFFRGKAIAGSAASAASAAPAAAAATGAAGRTGAGAARPTVAPPPGAASDTVIITEEGIKPAPPTAPAPRAPAPGSPAPVPAPGATNGAAGAPAGAASTTSATATPDGGRVTFAVAPGPMQLKLSIEGAAGQVLDSDFREIDVPDYSKVDPVLTEAAVFRARTQRDLSAYLGDPTASPTAVREFSRTERLLIRFHAYAPGGSAAPEARLLNRDGNKMSDIVVKPFAGGGDGAFQLELPLAPLPVGNYLVEVSLPGESKIKELVGFRITT